MPQSLLSVPNRASAPPVKGYLWLVPQKAQGKKYDFFKKLSSAQ
jgi:hypothetical protein